MREARQRTFGAGFGNWSSGFKKTGTANCARLNCHRFDRDANSDARIRWISLAKQTFPIGSGCFAQTTILQIQSVPQSGNDFYLGQLSLKQGPFPVFHAHRHTS